MKRRAGWMADKDYSRVETSSSAPQYCNVQIRPNSSRAASGAMDLGKPSKVNHKHRPMIERLLPLERIVRLFYERFDQPYVNPVAELSLEEFKAAFADIPESVVLEALTHWTDHSGKKVLQTKVARVNLEDKTVWFVHGLEESPQFENQSPLALKNRE